MSRAFKTYKGLDLPKLGEEILEFWEKENVFEKSVSFREGKTPYVFLKDLLLPMACQEYITF